MDGFVGRYEHSLDSKGRLVLPARLRPPFDPAGGFLVKGSGGCVALWPQEPYQQRLAELERQADEANNSKARARVRVFASAEPVTPDVQGRIPIAPYLQAFAELDPARVLVRGANKVVELWKLERWEHIEAMAEQELLDDEPTAS